MHWKADEFRTMVSCLEKRLQVVAGTIRWQQQWMAHYYEYSPDSANPNQPKQFNCVKLSFPNTYLMRECSTKIPYALFYNPNLSVRAEDVKVYEAKTVEPENKFLEALGIVPAGWFRVNKAAIPELYQTHAAIELECNMEDLEALTTKNLIPPLVICSFDIECYSETGEFPSAFNPGDHIICINTAVTRFGQWKIERFSHFVGECAVPIQSEEDKRTGSAVRLFCYKTERECLEAWRDFVVLDVGWQIRVGYNIFGFDDEYLGVRAARTNIYDETLFMTHDDEHKYVVKRKYPGVSFWRKENDAMQPESRFFRLSSMQSLVTPMMKTFMSSNAVGDNEYTLITVPGVVSIDAFPYIKAKYSLELYTLNYVAKEFLGMTKVDMTPEEIFHKYRMGPDERGQIVEYCARDCDLPVLLVKKLQILTDLVEMSRITNTTVDQLMTAGQTVKSWNQIVVSAHAEKHVMNVPKRDYTNDATIASNNSTTTTTTVQKKSTSSSSSRSDAVGYQGAKVFDPTIGFFMYFVLVLDFASLYPSIMYRKNLCYSTLVRDVKDLLELVAKEVALEHIPSGDGVTIHHFVQSWQGIVPKILQRLKAKRKAVKAEMGNYPRSSPEYMVLDARQNAVKVTMNSLYGVFGAKNGNLSCVPIAESVTRTGRDMILTTRDIIEKEYAQYGAKVIYGDTDSVMILMRNIEPEDKNIDMVLDLGTTMAARVTEYFRSLPERWSSSVELTFEKMYWPYFLQQKKHYVGLMWTTEGYKKNKTYDKIDSKGVASKRRDKFPALRKAITKIWDLLVKQRDISGAAQAMKSFLHDIVDDKLLLEDYILTSSIKSSYSKSDQLPAQIVANERRKAREPGSEFKPGSRAPYVFVIDQTLRVQPEKVSERAEDPDWVRKHPERYKIDRSHYLHLCETPFKHILDICFENGNRIIEDAKYALRNKLSGQMQLNQYFVASGSLSETGEYSMMTKSQSSDNNQSQTGSIGSNSGSNLSSSAAAASSKTIQKQEQGYNNNIQLTGLTQTYNIQIRDHTKNFGATTGTQSTGPSKRRKMTGNDPRQMNLMSFMSNQEKGSK